MAKQEKAGRVTEHKGSPPSVAKGKEGRVVQTVTTSRPNFPQHLVETPDGLKPLEDGSKIPH